MTEARFKEGIRFLENLLKDIKYDLSQNTLSCGVLPSLENLTLTKLAIMLWNGMCDEIVLHMSNHSPDRFLISDWFRQDIFEKKVLEKIPSLSLPLYCIAPLERMVGQIGAEISNFFTALEYRKHYFATLDKLKIYWTNLRWSQQGKINYLKTTEQLIDQTNLSARDKYLLACDSCLESRIRILRNELPEDFMSDFLDQDRYNPFRLMMFWTLYIRGEHERFSRIVHAPTGEYLLKWAVRQRKEVALQYIWENIADNDNKALIFSLVQFAVRQPNADNILLFLFKQMDADDLKCACLTMPDEFLKPLLRTSKWHNLFLPAAKCILKFITEMNIWNAFKIIIFCWHEKVLDLDEYQHAWDKMTHYFKKDVEHYFFGICGDLLYDYSILTARSDATTMELLLKLCSQQEKKNLLNDQRAVRTCSQLLLLGKFDFLDMFLRKMVTTDEEIIEYKKKIFDEKSTDICYDLVYKDMYELLDRVLIWFCPEEEERKRFKNGLPCKESIILHRILIYSKDAERRLMVLDKFLSWCFEEDQSQVAACKSIEFDLENNLRIYYGQHSILGMFFKQIKVLMRENKWGSVEKYWRWIFFADESKIKTWEEKLARIKKIVYLTCGEGGGVLIMRFVISCFDYEEVQKLREVLKKYNELSIVIMDLIQSDRFVETDDLLNWCFLADKSQIDEFKKEFMTSSGCDAVLMWLIEDKLPKAETLLTWFNPSCETARLFRETLTRYLNNEDYLQSKSKLCWKETLIVESENAWQNLRKRISQCLELLTEYSEGTNVSAKKHSNQDPISIDGCQRSPNSVKRTNEESPICVSKMRKNR